MHTGPKLYMDSLRLSVDALERLKPRGDKRWEGIQTVMAPIEWKRKET